MATLITEIKQKLYEELGVSDKVSKASTELLSQIIKDSRTVPMVFGKNYKEGDFFYYFGSLLIDVHYTIYYVNKIEDFDRSNFIGFSNYTKGRAKLSTTVLYVKSEKRYVDLEGTIQHEMEHLYQQHTAGKNFLSKEKSRTIYRKSNALINSSNNADRIVGLIIYYNNKFEKDAIANELYRTIMDNPNSNPYEILKSNTTYKNIKVIKKNVVDTDKFQETFESIVNFSFGKHYKWLKNMAVGITKAYMTKMGKTLAKAYKDLYGEDTPLDGTIFGRMNIPTK